MSTALDPGLGNALDAARALLAVQPVAADAWRALARAHQGRGDAAAAAACLRRAQRADPGNPRILTQLGHALLAQGQRDQSIRLYQSALAGDPRDADARTHLDRLVGPVPGGQERLERIHADAVRLQAEGRLREVLELHREALRIAPHLSGLWLATGLLAHDLGDRYLSLHCFELAARLAPTLLPAIEAARRICVAAGMPGKARHYSELAQRLGPCDDIRIALALTTAAIPASAAAIAENRRAYEAGLDAAIAARLTVTRLDAAQGMNGFFLAYHGANDRDLQVKAAGLLAGAAPWLRVTAPHCAAGPRRAGRIRIGFISAHLYDHSIGNTSRGLIAQLSRERFEVIVIRIMPSRSDAVTESIARTADRVLTLSPEIRAAQREIAALELDVLFYQDIGMEPKSYALALARLAPVQCVSFGHPNTTGIPTIDYFVSNDLYEPQGAEAHYSERLFLLRELPTLAYYHRPAMPQPATRDSFGLCAADHVYLCPQALYKIHPDLDALLGDILRRDPRGIVVLIGVPYYNYTELLQRRLERALGAAATRVMFLDPLPYARFMQLLALADVILDTPHFNGMNTSLEGFSVGTPIVTLPGRMQRRHTQAMYRKMGILECIATDGADYVDIAVRLGCDRGHADALRERILARCHVLYEDPRVVTEFERFFLTAVAAASPHQSGTDSGEGGSPRA